MNKGKILRGVTALAMVALPFMVVAPSVHAAEMSDGTWTRSSSTDTITVSLATALSSGDTIVLTFDDAYDTVVSSNPSGVTACGNSATAVTNTTDNTITLTLSSAASTGSCAIVGVFLATFDSSQLGQHSVAVNTTASGSAADYGVAVTATDLDDNTVDVSATVPQFINMTLSSTSIDLGVLSTGSVSTDSHTITVNTNDPNGYMIQITSDGALRDGSGNDINSVAEDSTVTAGNEEYGIAVAAGGTEEGNFNDDDTPIPTSPTNFVSNSNAVSSELTTVTYRASIAGNTVAGNYSQVVTYTIATQ